MARSITEISLTAFGVLMQVGPDQAVSNLSKWLAVVGIESPPVLQAPNVDNWITAACFIAVAALVFGPRILKKYRNSEFILLSEAALQAYEELRGTQLGGLSEGLNMDNPLGYHVYALAGKYPIYGNHLPSRKLELIPKLGDSTFDGNLAEDGSAITRNNNSPIWGNLMIEKKHGREYIKYGKSRKYY